MSNLTGADLKRQTQYITIHSSENCRFGFGDREAKPFQRSAAPHTLGISVKNPTCTHGINRLKGIAEILLVAKLTDLSSTQRLIPEVEAPNHTTEAEPAVPIRRRLGHGASTNTPSTDLPVGQFSPLTMQWAFLLARQLTIQVHTLKPIIPAQGQVIPALRLQIACDGLLARVDNGAVERALGADDCWLAMVMRPASIHEDVGLASEKNAALDASWLFRRETEPDIVGYRSLKRFSTVPLQRNVRQ